MKHLTARVGEGVSRVRDRTRSVARRVFGVAQRSRTSGRGSAATEAKRKARVTTLYREVMAITRAVVRQAETVGRQVPRRRKGLATKLGCRLEDARLFWPSPTPGSPCRPTSAPRRTLAWTAWSCPGAVAPRTLGIRRDASAGIVAPYAGAPGPKVGSVRSSAVTASGAVAIAASPAWSAGSGSGYRERPARPGTRGTVAASVSGDRRAEAENDGSSRSQALPTPENAPSPLSFRTGK